MNVTIQKKNANSIELVIENCELAIINSLRRVIMSDIPTWSIEKVSIHENTTLIPSEMIAHRLGLIPVIPLTNFVTDESVISFCKTATQRREIWYLEMADPGSVEPAIKGIPIVKVAKGQKLHFTATLQQGTGFEHAKWSPVSTCFFQELGPNKWLFKVETIGHHEPIEIVKEGFEILRSKVLA